MNSKLRRIISILDTMIRHPRSFLRAFANIPEICRGEAIETHTWRVALDNQGKNGWDDNPLWNYFSKYETGPGIWKWTHYFEAYHRHLSRFVGKKCSILEIGIYSGGSLPMWLSYFGDKCSVIGVDIEPACKSYETDQIQVLIGDQQDRNFWAHVKEITPVIDILIDDGGHTPEQQMVTLEEMLPFMPAGSVYICEDIHGISNRFAAFATGIVNRLNAMTSSELNSNSTQIGNVQQAIHSVHFYPYMCVIEKHTYPPKELSAPKHGTDWQPFL